MNVLIDLDQTCVLDVNSYQFSEIPSNYFTNYITHIYSKDEFGFSKNVLFARPMLQSFLEKVNKFATISVFTAASKKYADIAVENLFTTVKPKHIFFRDDCIKGKKMFDKDKPIEYICSLYPNEFTLENTIIVDDNESVKESNKENCILVKPWTLDSLKEGCKDEMKKDRELLKVLEHLIFIARNKGLVI